MLPGRGNARDQCRGDRHHCGGIEEAEGPWPLRTGERPVSGEQENEVEGHRGIDDPDQLREDPDSGSGRSRRGMLHEL